jgi:hypothetical protein
LDGAVRFGRLIAQVILFWIGQPFNIKNPFFVKAQLFPGCNQHFYLGSCSVDIANESQAFLLSGQQVFKVIQNQKQFPIL